MCCVFLFTVSFIITLVSSVFALFGAAIAWINRTTGAQAGPLVADSGPGD